MDLQTLSDKELLHNIKNLVQREREIFTEIVRHLQEIQRRRLFSDLGYRSLWDYCVKGLNYSESQTQRTMDAMRLIQEIPEVEKIVEKGELSLSNLVQAQVHFRAEQKSGSVLTLDDKLEVLDSLKNKSAREGEKILLEISSAEPAPVKESIRQVTAHISEIKFGADEAFLKKMEQVKGLLAHKHPRMSTKELMEVVFEMALNNLDPSRKASNKKCDQSKRTEPPTSVVKIYAKKRARKYISLKIKRTVWTEAHSRCEICQSKYALEIDHKMPVSLGGTSERENLRLLCRNCNQRAALIKLGDEKMQKFIT